MKILIFQSLEPLLCSLEKWFKIDCRKLPSAADGSVFESLKIIDESAFLEAADSAPISKLRKSLCVATVDIIQNKFC